MLFRSAFHYRADDPMPTASLIKLPVMVEAYRQAEAKMLSLDKMIALRAEDKVPGSGILTPHFSPGTSLSLRDLIRLMIAYSDNTATNLVVEQIGLANTSRTMETMGWSNTKLHSLVFRRDTSIFPERSREYGLGSTTAHETIALLERLHRRELVSAAASESMLQHLLQCEDRATFAKLLPPSVRIAHKTGSVTGVRTDAGLILAPGSTIAICVLTRKNRERNDEVRDSGEWLCAQIAKTAYELLVPQSKSGEATTSLAIGASGVDVMRIQAALNAKLDPSPNLDVDGEFGPLTQAAVRRFQKEHQMEQSGIVTEATRKKLLPNP